MNPLFNIIVILQNSKNLKFIFLVITEYKKLKKYNSSIIFYKFHNHQVISTMTTTMLAPEMIHSTIE